MIKYRQPSALAMRQTSEGLAPKLRRFQVQEDSTRSRVKPRICNTCGQRRGNTAIGPTCRECLRTCECGGAKDHRATLCIACSNRQKATAQWANPESSKRIREGLRVGGLRRRFRYSDIAAESNWITRPEDGRRYIWYWDDQGKKRTIYRYQWVWQQANGLLPPRHHVHHVNEDKCDDRLSNLKALTPTEHIKHHMADGTLIAKMLRGAGKKPNPAIPHQCILCGTMFMKRRRLERPNLYCSRACRYEAQRTWNPLHVVRD